MRGTEAARHARSVFSAVSAAAGGRAACSAACRRRFTPTARAASGHAAQRSRARGSMRFAAAISRRRAKRFRRRPKRCPRSRGSRSTAGAPSLPQGENDKATEQFLAAAAAPDRRLAAAAHYNLGCLAIAKAKKQFGKHPEAPTRRCARRGLKRSCKRPAICAIAWPSIRSTPTPDTISKRFGCGSSTFEEVWRQRDREKSRKEMNLLQFLQMLEGEAARSLRGRQPHDGGRARFAAAARGPA